MSHVHDGSMASGAGITRLRWEASTTMVYRRLLSYVRPMAVPMLIGVALTAVASLATIGYAKAVTLLFSAVSEHSLRLLEAGLLGGLALNIVKNAAQYAGSYTMQGVGQKVIAKIRGDLFARIQFLPLPIFDRWSRGEVQMSAPVKVSSALHMRGSWVTPMTIKFTSMSKRVWTSPRLQRSKMGSGKN